MLKMLSATGRTTLSVRNFCPSHVILPKLQIVCDWPRGLGILVFSSLTEIQQEPQMQVSYNYCGNNSSLFLLFSVHNLNENHKIFHEFFNIIISRVTWFTIS